METARIEAVHRAAPLAARRHASKVDDVALHRQLLHAPLIGELGRGEGREFGSATACGIPGGMWTVVAGDAVIQLPSR